MNNTMTEDAPASCGLKEGKKRGHRLLNNIARLFRGVSDVVPPGEESCEAGVCFPFTLQVSSFLVDYNACVHSGSLAD